MKIKVSTEIDGYLKADHLKISTTSIESVDVGEIVWNQVDGTFDMGLIGGVTLQAGQEMHIYGKATEDISNGETVMFAGVQGDHLLIARADATIINANPEYLIGVSTQSFTTNQFGYVTTLGNVRGLNTLAYTLGTILYYNSESATDGLLTATEPTAPNAKIEVAAVVKVHGTQGILLVRPHVMPRVKDLQDIYAPSPTQAKGLFWNNTNSRYENYTVPEILGYTPADDANVVHKTGNESITGNKSFSNSTSNPAITVSNSNNGSQGIFSTNTSGGSGIYSGNSSSGTGITSSNGGTGNGIYSGNGGTGTGIFSYNGGTGIGIFLENITSGINAYLTNVGSGKNLVLNNTSTGTGMPFTIQKIGVDKLTISDSGDIKGNKVILGTTVDNLVDTLQVTGYSIATGYKIPSGLPSWFLKADGTYDTNTYALDSNVVHKTGNETITGTKTFNQIGSGTNIASYIIAGGVGMYLQNDSSGSNIFSNNKSNGYGIHSQNYGDYTNAIGIYSTNYFTGTGNYFYNFGTGRNLVLENHFESTGLPFTVSKNGFDKLTISDTGYITSASGAIFASSISALNLSGTNTGDQTLTGLGGVPNSRTITINGVTQDLSANRTFTVAGSMSIGGTITSATAGSVLFAGIGGVLQQDNSQFFWDDTNNRLGIGTSSPTFKQHTIVSGSTGDIAGFSLTGNINNPTLLIKSDATNQVITFRGGSNSSIYPAIAFDTGTGGERMRITSVGNVGIGTTSPGAKLEVSGNIKLSGQIGQSATPYSISFPNDYSDGNTANKSKLFFYNDGGLDIYGIATGNLSDMQYHSGGTGNTASCHVFYTGNIEKFRIANSGEATFASNIRVTGSFKDSSNLPGTSGQVLSSTGTGTSWITNGGLKGVHSLIKLSSGQSTSACITAIATSLITCTANRLVVYPYIPAQTITSVSLYINVTTAIAGSNAQILIYSDLNGKPNSRLYQSTNLDCATLGNKTVITTQTFVAGTIYWIGVQASSTQALSAPNTASLINIGSSGVSQINSVYISPLFGAAPALFGTPVGNLSLNPPFIGITL